jgi:hypothetical protein
MNLLAGYPFVVAPHFHLTADLQSRLLLGAGLTQMDGIVRPPQTWRPPDANELALLIRTSAEPVASTDLDAAIGLFQIPAHIRSQWWQLLERAAGQGELGDGRLPGFDSFARQVGDFLAFKNVSVPPEARWELVVGSPAQPFDLRDSKKKGATGLRPSLAPDTPWTAATEQGWPRLWGGINLGDEEMALVFLNLPWQLMDEQLFQTCPDHPSPVTVAMLADTFLSNCPDYPTVLLALAPGEGYRLPRGGVVLDSYWGSKQEPDVLLSISVEHQCFL